MRENRGKSFPCFLGFSCSVSDGGHRDIEESLVFWFFEDGASGRFTNITCSFSLSS